MEAPEAPPMPQTWEALAASTDDTEFALAHLPRGSFPVAVPLPGGFSLEAPAPRGPVVSVPALTLMWERRTSLETRAGTVATSQAPPACCADVRMMTSDAGRPRDVSQPSGIVGPETGRARELEGTTNTAAVLWRAPQTGEAEENGAPSGAKIPDRLKQPEAVDSSVAAFAPTAPMWRELDEQLGGARHHYPLSQPQTKSGGARKRRLPPGTRDAGVWRLLDHLPTADPATEPLNSTPTGNLGAWPHRSGVQCQNSSFFRPTVAPTLSPNPSPSSGFLCQELPPLAPVRVVGSTGGLLCQQFAVPEEVGQRRSGNRLTRSLERRNGVETGEEAWKVFDNVGLSSVRTGGPTETGFRL